MFNLSRGEDLIRNEGDFFRDMRYVQVPGVDNLSQLRPDLVTKTTRRTRRTTIFRSWHRRPRICSAGRRRGRKKAAAWVWMANSSWITSWWKA